MAGGQYELMPARSRSQASQRTNMAPDEAGDDREDEYLVDPKLHQRTLWKLDCLLLPFLALLFLFNALDKANVCASQPAYTPPSPSVNADMAWLDRKCRICAFHSRCWT